MARNQRPSHGQSWTGGRCRRRHGTRSRTCASSSKSSPRRRTARSRMSRPTLGLAALVAVVAVAIVGVVLVVRPGAAGGRPAVPHFVEVAAEAGIDHTYDGDFDYFVGGGVAAFDCDGDGLQDLFFAGGSEPAALYR